MPKKDGTWRPYGYYRRLNDRMESDAYPIPHVHDFLAGLAGKSIFSKIDLVKGYHQIPMSAEDVQKTAIATPFGLFEFMRMPFGLKTAAQTFQHLMDSVTAQLNRVFVYLDDVLVASETAEQHESDLRQLFAALRRFGLVVIEGKCVFGVGEIDFLGHRVSVRGIRPLPDKVAAFFKAHDPVSNRQRHQLAFISEFGTDIAHVPGMENVVVDALTRQYDDDEAAAIVHAISHELSDISLADLAADQPSIKEETHSSVNGSNGMPRVLVPEVHRRLIFKAIHNLAHPSGRATLAIVSRTYVWPRMRSDILCWSRQCHACGVSKIACHTKPPVLPIPIPEKGFEHVHVDIVGPFPPDRGYRHLLTMMDRTTRWPEAVPITDTTAETIVQSFLDNWISRYGIPTTVTSDRGAQFTSELWRGSLRKFGIRVMSTTSYHPQANGLVECFHRTLKNALRCVGHLGESWSRSLPWVLLGIRNAPRTDTATSTAEVVFITPLRIPGLCFQSEQGGRSTAKEQLEQARANVEVFLPKRLDLRRFKESPLLASTLRTAEYVYVWDDTLGKPGLAAKYTGPFRVLKRDWDNHTFLLEMGKKEETISLSRLKAAFVPKKAQ